MRGRSSCPCREAERSASPSTRVTQHRLRRVCAKVGVRRTDDGGRTWVDCALPDASLLAGGERRRRSGVRGDRAEPAVPQRRSGETWRELEALLELPVAADLELSAAAVDVACALDCAQPTRRRPAAGRDRARRVDALRRRRRELAGSPAGRAAGRAFAGLASARGGTGLRGGRWWRRLQRRRGENWQPADEGRDRHYTWSVAVDPDGSRVLVRVGEHRPVRRPWRAGPAGADLSMTRRMNPGCRSQAACRSRSRRCRTRCSQLTIDSSPASPTGSSGRASIR